MKIDVSKELQFKTARSGGKGGQNVNKVESMVEVSFHVANSMILSKEQIELITRKLANKINSEGFLQSKSQVHRSQLENKAEAVRKLHQWISEALKKEKKRIATSATKASRQKRLESKKKQSEHKQNRKKISHKDL